MESVAIRYGGTGFAAQQLGQSIAKADHEVTMCLLRDEQDVWPRSQYAKLIWMPLPVRFGTRILSLWRLGDGRADAVHIHGIWNPWWALAAFFLKLRSVPFAISPHGSLEPSALAFKPLKKRIALFLYQAWTLKAANALVVTSEKEAAGLRALGFEKSKFRLVPNGVSIPPEKLLASSDQGFDERFKADSSRKRTFLFLSRIHPIKGLPLLVEAWAKVRRPGCRVVVAGHDECGHVAEVTGLAQRLGVLSDFEFRGAVHGADKVFLFSQTDVFVLPTHSENFGIVIAEALSYGLPVITTKGAPWGLLQDKGCGWWVDISVDALADALEEAMNLPIQALEAMGAKGREWMRNSFDLNVIGLNAVNSTYLPMMHNTSAK